MPVEQFACPTPKCGYAIASEGLNGIQLKALRLWKKTCPKCGKQQKWVEQLPLLNTETLQTKIYGGSSHEKTTSTISQDRNARARQKRAADRGAGLH